MTSPEKKNVLLKKLANKEITMQDFLYRCAIWGMDTACWVEYELLPQPIAPPEWDEYQALPLAKKAKVSEEFFHALPIRQYLDKRSHVYATNYSNLCWLRDMEEKILDMDKDDGLILRRLAEKIEEFKNWFEKKDPTVEKIKQVFSGRETLAYKED